MKTSQRKLEELLWVLGLSRAARSLRRVLRGPRALRDRRLMRQFFAPLLPPGALVFDVGANVGTLTEVFASLGAKVIAVEPNPDCARHIQLVTERAAVEVIQAAAGGKAGTAILHVADRRDKMSSLSEEWCEAMRKQSKVHEGIWTREITVPVVTLDALIEKYGMPHYIKIDVEGYEENVLDGLSRQPSLLSFEFNRAYFDTAICCLEKKLLDRSLFNFTVVDPIRFELPEWVGREALRNKLIALGEEKGLGDVFVRRP
ncbi:MAG: FkbM family methyltransferase [Candidatus Acidiferrales bacterium]